jgi:hypothetical protein
MGLRAIPADRGRGAQPVHTPVSREGSVWSGEDSAWVLCSWLSSWPEVQGLRLFSPSPSPMLQERALLSPAEWKVVERGLSFREASHMPFWDSVFLASFEADGPVKGIVEAASYHNCSDHRVLQIGRGEVTADRLRNLSATSEGGEYVAVSSVVELADGTRGHIPLIDYHVPPSDHGLLLVRSVLEQLDIGGGYILLSGKSYHFIGDTLVKERDLMRFLGRCLLYAPIIDRAWIAHQIIESACALRISPKERGGTPPRVISRFDQAS